jgi:hypothetical protein
MTELLYTEQKFWNRQKKAREYDQNFMKLSPNDVEFLLNTILAERTRADLLIARIDELVPQCDATYAPYRAMVQVARAEVDKFSADLAAANATIAGLTAENARLATDLDEARKQYAFYFGLYKSICFPLKQDPPFVVGS